MARLLRRSEPLVGSRRIVTAASSRCEHCPAPAAFVPVALVPGEGRTPSCERAFLPAVCHEHRLPPRGWQWFAREFAAALRAEVGWPRVRQTWLVHWTVEMANGA